MKAVIDDLGVQAYGDTWLHFRHAAHPKTGAELVLGSLSLGGFMLIDPAAESGIQARMGHSSPGWGIAQAPDGSIWQCAYGGRDGTAPLCSWNWEGAESKPRVDLPGQGYFSIDVAPDGRVYAPHYSGNTLYRYDPASNKLENLGAFGEFGEHIRDVCCAQDGWVYVTATDYTRSCIVALDPISGRRVRLAPADDGASKGKYGTMLRAGDGKILVCETKWGRECWHECVGGKTHPLPPSEARLAVTAISYGASWTSNNTTPLAFSDGSYIKAVDRKAIVYVTANGNERRFTVAREESPIRIFSVESGGGKIWGGTFIPLTLFCHDPATGKAVFYDNPTETSGEIYNSVWSNGKLFMASYTRAALTRFDPSKPFKMDRGISANPAHLGFMKEDGLPLQRPHGKALAPDGTVFFAARGDYGCNDSGISRIDPRAEEVTRWIYPNTTFGALCCLPGRKLLLVGENRRDERGIRFTFISPENGEIAFSGVMIEDEGHITSWLPDDRDVDLVHGMYPHRGMMFTYSVAQKKIVRELREIGEHGIKGNICYNMLLFGPDGRILGLTNKQVFAVARDMSAVEPIADYQDHADGNFYRFGMTRGPDGHIYFPNGTHLMRLRI